MKAKSETNTSKDNKICSTKSINWKKSFKKSKLFNPLSIKELKKYVHKKMTKSTDWKEFYNRKKNLMKTTWDKRINNFKEWKTNSKKW